MHTIFGQANNEQYIDQYLIQKIENPDPGSEFEKHSKLLKDNSIPTNQRLPILQQQGYQTYLMIDDKQDLKTVAGFVAYQVHQSIAHVFRFEVEPQYQGKGYSSDLFEALLQEPKLKEQGIKAIKIGKGPKDTSEPNQKSVSVINRLDNLGKYKVDKESHLIEL